MILLDTHTLIWLDGGSPMLGKKALSLINKALKAKQLYVSTISFWEVAMLIKKGRLSMQPEVAVWRRTLLENGLQEIPLAGDIALESANLEKFHGDPADRIIVATALHLPAKLCTADKKILAWGRSASCIDASK